jgi:DNA polymerase-3 subunit gamma/tau
MALALYRKYRSRSLDEIVGQKHVTDLLSQAIKQGRVAHAYLFTGPKGVGKTSIARILAHEINELPYTDDSTSLDIIEIDAASNNGVEDIRDLRDRVQVAPAGSKKKVYIIDEVHMLSKPAFNALLKTLEEPPEHVVFILATTDADKIPDTILSRTQRYNFKRAGQADITANLKRIAKQEKFNVEDEAYELIAQHSDGSFRDSVSLFDQLATTLGKDQALTGSAVRTALGLAPDDYIQGLVAATEAGDIGRINQTLGELETAGTPVRTITLQLIAHIRRHLHERPALLRLVDGLLEVSKSASPELKLLTTLCLFAPPATAPAAAEPEPVPASETEPEPVRQPPAKPKATPSKPAAKRGKTVAAFDWTRLLDYVRKEHVALHSVLAKCEAVLEGDHLVLYTKSSFYKRKLDDSKYRTLLNDSFQALGMNDIEIEIKATAPPLKDSQAAKVAAIMGGGEEVKL